ncbi:MAG: MFS transporter [Coxiellaceae bacterium]|nr:MFS transporter [Coxiellaceae bacterium]
MRGKLSYFYRLFPMLLLIFIDSFSFFVIIPVLLKIFYHNHYALLPESTSLAVRNMLTGIMIALSMFSALIFAPIIGRASDKFGRKKTLLFCIGFVFLGFLLPMVGIIQKNIVLIFIGRFISGIGSASQPVAQAAVADLCTGDEKARYLSFIAFMMTLALIVGPLAGGLLSDSHIEPYFHVITPFVFSLGMSAFCFILIAYFFKETLSKKSMINTIGFFETIAGLPKIIKQYSIGALVVLFFCLELGWSQYYQSIDLLLQLKWHFSIEKISIFSASMGIAMSFGLLIIYPVLLRFFTLKKMLIANVFLVLIGLLACATIPFSLAQWFFASVVALCTGMAYISLITIISNKVDAKYQGLLMGYLSALLYLAWVLTAFNSGFLMSLYKNMPLYLAVVFLVIGIIVEKRTVSRVKLEPTHAN